MFAREMSDPDNRGRIIWVLASSRPDLIEVDLKRPGRVDVKIPIFPTTTAEESFTLIQALCRRLEIGIDTDDFASLQDIIPTLLTPGAAEALAIKIYRIMATEKATPVKALRQVLAEYQSPGAREIMDFQIALAVNEATDMDFVPEIFRDQRKA